MIGHEGFPEITLRTSLSGVSLIEQIRKAATYLSYGNRLVEFHKYIDALNQSARRGQLTAKMKPKVDLNTTRVAAPHNLITSVIRLHKALVAFERVGTNELLLDLTPLEWQSVVEIESVLEVVKVATTLAQYEHLYTGGFYYLIKSYVLKRLYDPNGLQVINLSLLNEKPLLPRMQRATSKFTAVGSTCVERAKVEGCRRFCGLKIEDAPMSMPAIVPSDRDLICALLDLRLMRSVGGSGYLSTEERNSAKVLLEDAYVEFAATARDFMAEPSDDESRAAEAPVVPPSSPKPQAVRTMPALGIVAQSYVSSDDSDSDDDHSTRTVDHNQTDREEFKRVFKKWSKQSPDWSEIDPKLKDKTEFDLIGDLLHVDVGKIYAEYEKHDPERKQYGWLPDMARCRIGAGNAESFSERTLSVANQVVAEGNTLLADAEVEMVAVLRMNKWFMEFMRKHHPELAHEKFGCNIDFGSS